MRAPESNRLPGLAISLPAAVGAVPCVASNSARVSDMLTPGGHTETADLSRESVGDIISVQIGQCKNAVLFGAKQGFLEHGVGQCDL